MCSSLARLYITTHTLLVTVLSSRKQKRSHSCDHVKLLITYFSPIISHKNTITRAKHFGTLDKRRNMRGNVSIFIECSKKKKKSLVCCFHLSCVCAVRSTEGHELKVIRFDTWLFSWWRIGFNNQKTRIYLVLI